MDRVSQLISRWAVTPSGDASVQATLDRATCETADLLPVDGAGIVLFPTATTPAYLAASDATSLTFENLQRSLHQGPCFRAQQTMQPVSVPDLALEEDFPAFNREARGRGLSGVFAFPLRKGGAAVGALDLYRMSPGPLAEVEMRAAQTLADVFTAYVVDAQTRAIFEETFTREHSVVEQLQALDVERSDFVAATIHELAGPIAGIIGYAELLELEPDNLSDRQRRFIAGIRRNGDELRALAADLLTTFTLEPGVARRAYVRVDLRAVVAATQKKTQEKMTSASPSPAVDLFFEVPDVPVFVLGDPDQLERMLTNLVSNAVKYTPPGGLVLCMLSRGDGQALLEVRDTGIGIPVDEQDEVFTRFFRASNAAGREIPGTGLGLAIVESIAQGHGGAVGVSSELGAGTCFRVRIPAA
ncbi:sensor histidine kinase [Marmoricola sp. RAF53]|uniref:sensor histidine kinase n=1 Tax=Marmoricola sp. RAF53 TaxID=3233059 RepID=UPI003F99809B